MRRRSSSPSAELDTAVADNAEVLAAVTLWLAEAERRS